MTEPFSRAFVLAQIEDSAAIEEYGRKRRLVWEGRLPTASAEPVAASPPPAPAREQSAPPFMGRPMTSKFGGRCAVCGGAIQQGVAIVYRGADKTSAHAACGHDDGGRGR